VQRLFFNSSQFRSQLALISSATVRVKSQQRAHFNSAPGLECAALDTPLTYNGSDLRALCALLLLFSAAKIDDSKMLRRDADNLRAQ
jgi:hypothetical protein